MSRGIVLSMDVRAVYFTWSMEIVCSGRPQCEHQMQVTRSSSGPRDTVEGAEEHFEEFC